MPLRSMAPRRPCPSCATVFSRWNPKYLKGMCERRHLAGWVACLLGMYFNCVIQIFIQIRSEVFVEIPNKYVSHPLSSVRVCVWVLP